MTTAQRLQMLDASFSHIDDYKEYQTAVRDLQAQLSYFHTSRWANDGKNSWHELGCPNGRLIVEDGGRHQALGKGENRDECDNCRSRR